jgi:hypothetical protein
MKIFEFRNSLIGIFALIGLGAGLFSQSAPFPYLSGLFIGISSALWITKPHPQKPIKHSPADSLK